MNLDDLDPDNLPPMTAQELKELRSARDATAEEAKDADKPFEVELHEDRTKEFTGPNWSRLKTEWGASEAPVIVKMQAIADGTIHKEFADAFQIMNNLYLLVREPVTDENGVPVLDVYGYYTWRQSEFGGPEEDWSKLLKRDRETFLMKITSGVMAWDQKAQNIWGEAMFAKLAYEEAFAHGYLAAINKRAENDRVQSGRAVSSEARQLGVFKSLLSRKADALVRSMTLIGQRLKDTGEL